MHTLYCIIIHASIQIGNYEDIKINDLVSLDALDIDVDVRQLFVDVLRRDPMLRPGALNLLNRPIISSAVDYGRYFDECYDSEDTEDLEASPAVECDDSVPTAEISQHPISLASSGSQSSLHSLWDKVGDLPHFPCSSEQLQQNRSSQDSGVGGDVEKSIGSSAVFSSQASMRSSNSGSNRGGNQHMLPRQDLGLEDCLAAIAGECSQAGGKC